MLNRYLNKSTIQRDVTRLALVFIGALALSMLGLWLDYQLEIDALTNDLTLLNADEDVMAVARSRLTDSLVIALFIFLALGAAYSWALLTFVRRQAKSEMFLRQAVGNLSKAEEVAGLGYWQAEVGENQVQWSPQMYDIYGQDPETFIPTMQTIMSIVHPADRRKLDRFRAQLIASQDTVVFELRLKWPNGEVRYIEHNAECNVDSSGIVTGMFGVVLDITDRKRVALELADKEETLRMSVEATGAAIWEYSVERRTLEISSRLAEILGIPDHEWEPSLQAHSERVHPDDDERVTEAFRRMLHADEPFNAEYRVRHRRGHWVWLSNSGKALRNTDGQVEKAVGSLVDVTQRKKTELAVLESEKRYRALIDGSIQGILIHRKFKPLFCNDAYARMLGYAEAQELMAQDSLLPHLPKELQKNVEDHWSVVSSGTLDGRVMRGPVYTSNGKEVWTDAIGRIVDWKGEPAFQIAVVDVTETHAVEQALAEREEQFRILADNSGDLITLRNQEGHFIYASPSAERITGYTADEMISRSKKPLAEQSQVGSRFKDQGRVVQDEDAPFIWQFQRKDGDFIWLETSRTEIPSEDDGGVRTLATSRDVTERVENERALRTARDQLQELARNLDSARLDAEAANAAKSQFLAQMSHELRTPMTGVLGMADLLMGTPLDGEQKELTTTLRRSATTLLGLLNDVLDFSKIEAGKLDLEETNYRLSAIMDDLSVMFTPALSEKGLGYDHSIDENIPAVLHGDPTRVRQILVNLVGNAVKFTETGGIHVSVTTLPPGKMKIAVKDTGIGMDDATQQRVFEAFTQADVATTRRFGGTGLGLAITRNLVDMMGGQIKLESAPGEGSEFIVEIPAVQGSEEQLLQIEAQQTNEQSAGMNGTGAPLNILLAEDNETNRLLITTMMQRHGHIVTAVEDGRLAVEAWRNASFDVILMDMQMPVMDGVEAMRAIRDEEQAKVGLPIIALTADAIIEHHHEYRAAGATEVHTKPINWSRLTSALARLTGSTDADDDGVAIAANASEAGSRTTDGEAPQDDASPLLDQSYITALEETLTRPVAQTLVHKFCSNLTNYIGDLRSGFEAQDLESARKTAHTIKGLASQFGAVRVSMIAKQIEQDMQSQEEGLAHLGDLEQLVPATLEEVRKTDVYGAEA